MSKDIIISEEDAREYVLYQEEHLGENSIPDKIAKVFKSQLPTWTRQEVLEFKYKPKKGEKCWALYWDSLHVAPYEEVYHPALNIGGRFVFAPTKELAEELKQIWEGTWLPLKNDNYVWCDKAIKKNSGVGTCKAINDIPRERLSDTVYQPSDHQLESWIERNKPKEPSEIEILKKENTRLDEDNKYLRRMIDRIHELIS